MVGMLSAKNKVGACVLIILMVVNTAILGSAGAEGQETGAPGEFIFDSITTTVWIDSGDMFYIYFDPLDMEIAARPPPTLPPECIRALDMVPEWLKGNLSYKFRELNEDYAVTFANLIIDSPDPRYIDEIAFVIAHSAVQNLQDDYFFPELISHNAQLVYDNDQYLNYVDIVERGDYTTVVYKDRNNVTIELDRDIYYWYIVHPKLSDELATYVDPEYNYVYDAPHDRNHGTPPPTGKFWRDWLFNEADAGYPLLKDRLSEAWTVWEAISKCNGWMSDSMSFTSDEERPIQPVRIYRKHIGRCGEYQDMRNAIARAGLIPSTCTINSAEDHVWNEFWDKRWIHWDGQTDNPMVYENGWGKKISSVWNTRGDGHIWSVSNKYTAVCYYTATVLDADGMPVDGVLVDVATENYYNPDLLTTTTWGPTDYTGRVNIPLGDERNYWSSAESDTLGTDPLNGVTQVIQNSVAGENYTHTFNLPMSAEQLRVTDIPPPGNPDEEFRMEISYDVVANIAKSENSYTGEEGDMYGPSGDIDFFISNSINYNLYLGGLSFNAYEVDLKSTNGSLSFVIPDDNRHYIVLSNEFSQTSCKIINITVDIISELEIEITGPADHSEFSLGDDITITGTSWAPEGVDTVEISLDDSQEWATTIATGGSGDDFSTWLYELSTVGLSPGEHRILARARLGEASLTTFINVTLNDVTDPVVLIENPGEGAAYKLGEILTINGTASDNAALQTLEIIIDSDEANSTDITHLLIDGYFSYDIGTHTLGYGNHAITIRGTDTSQNIASVTRNVRITEKVLPNVRIHSPDEGSIFRRGDTVVLSGKATDNMELVSLEITMYKGEPMDIFDTLDVDGYWTYEWNTKPHASGEYTVEVTAADGSDNVATDDVTIILDGSAPVAYIHEPIENQVFMAGNTIVVKGTASDDVELGSVYLTFDEGTPVDITRKVNDGEWRYNWDSFGLESGRHIISITAIDKAGHMTETGISIVVDTEDPVVEIHGIDEVIEIGEWITIRGTAPDDIEIESLTLVIDDEETIDITSSLSYGVWMWDLDTSDMNEGIHIITVIARDGVGNEAEEFILIELAEEGSISDGSPGDGIFRTDPQEGKDSSDEIDTEAFILLIILFMLIGLAVVALLSVRAVKKKDYSNFYYPDQYQR
ncbi:MAG: hypothetical protein JSV56_03905 [Methanomassiliicoccales archaeon]|nr:MAG: hypothetical protein JSV56_03905 [Methanomassiliicoccales archaeon]